MLTDAEFWRVSREANTAADEVLADMPLVESGQPVPGRLAARSLIEARRRQVLLAAARLCRREQVVPGFPGVVVWVESVTYPGGDLGCTLGVRQHWRTNHPMCPEGDARPAVVAAKLRARILAYSLRQDPMVLAIAQAIADQGGITQRGQLDMGPSLGLQSIATFCVMRMQDSGILDLLCQNADQLPYFHEAMGDVLAYWVTRKVSTLAEHYEIPWYKEGLG